MRKCRVSVKTAIGALAVVAGAANLVAAQEVSLSNLALKNTYLKTRSDKLELSTSASWTSIFSPTSITCPGTSGTCTARIELSVRVGMNHSFDPFDSVKCRVLRGGIVAPTLALPGSVQLTFMTGTAFAWIAPGLPLGSSTINVQCAGPLSPPSPMFAKERTLAIDVYKP